MPKVNLQRKPVWYPADDVPRSARRAMAKKTGSRPQPAGAKVRSSIEAGKVLILLSGRNRGRRVVCLGVLPSGLLLVTGPFSVNGVPLRRVNQRYVIATSTSIEGVKGIKLPECASSEAAEKAWFGKDKAAKAAAKAAQRSGEEAFFRADEEDVFVDDEEAEKFDTEVVDAPAGTVTEARKAAQAAVDGAILALPAFKGAGGEEMKDYLKAAFTLSKGDKPHAMKF